MGISIMAVFTGALFAIISLIVFFTTWNFGLWLFIAIGGALILYGVFRYKKIRNNSRTVDGKKYGKKKYALNGTSISGLPCGEAACKVTVFKSAINFKAGKNNYDLEMNRIVSALNKPRSEVVGASTGSAVAGAALFGVLGAIVASRPKSKTDYIMVINYIGTKTRQTETIAVAFDKTQKYKVDDAVYFINKKTKNGGHTTL